MDNNIRAKALSNNEMSLARKQRSDKGKTILNNSNKRKSEFTAKKVFKKMVHTEKHDDLKNEDVLQMWTESAATTNALCARHAEEQVLRGPHLLGELQNALSRTNGSVTWAQLASPSCGLPPLSPGPAGRARCR